MAMVIQVKVFKGNSQEYVRWLTHVKSIKCFNFWFLRVINLERAMLSCDYQPLPSKEIGVGVLTLRSNERSFSGTNHLDSLIWLKGINRFILSLFISSGLLRYAYSKIYPFFRYTILWALTNVYNIWWHVNNTTSLPPKVLWYPLVVNSLPILPATNTHW